MVVQQQQNEVPPKDKWLYRMVILVLGLVAVLALGGVVWLRLHELEVPDALVAFGSSALGAIAGVLAPTPAQ